MSTKPRLKLCACDGRYVGCNHSRPCLVAVVDDRWGPWCAECNPRRMAAIKADLERLSDRRTS